MESKKCKCNINSRTCPSAEQNSFSLSSSISLVVKWERSSKKYRLGGACSVRQLVKRNFKVHLLGRLGGNRQPVKNEKKV